MRILYLGDIVGEKSLDYLMTNLPALKKSLKVNLVLANAENVTKGSGLVENDYLKLMKAGISGITMGNHTYSKYQIKDFINDANICRPANLYNVPGKRYLTINYNGKKITIINLLGRVFMNQACDCPFRTLDSILEEVKSDYYIVDIHAEATSEKIALGYYADGRVSAVLGTHTHVQTNDAKILPKGTMYITDLGMCGPEISVLGSDKDAIINRFITGMYTQASVANSKLRICGAVLDFTHNKIEIINLVEGRNI